MRRGLFPGGNVPYGFRRTGKELEVDAAGAKTVERIFGLAAIGSRATAVATALNVEGLVLSGATGSHGRSGRWPRSLIGNVFTATAAYDAGRCQRCFVVPIDSPKARKWRRQAGETSIGILISVLLSGANQQTASLTKSKPSVYWPGGGAGMRLASVTLSPASTDIASPGRRGKRA